jgi:hypothetical protein
MGKVYQVNVTCRSGDYSKNRSYRRRAVRSIFAQRDRGHRLVFDKQSPVCCCSCASTAAGVPQCKR